MNGKVVLSFILGAAGCAVGMYFGMKHACEAYIDKEIKQFKADYEASHESKCEENSKNEETSAEDLDKSAEIDMEKKVDAAVGPVVMTPKECLIQFKEAYCEKGPKNNKDPEFRCYKCLFRRDNICLINNFISRQFAKED